ncbi:MAG: class I SAM-dependent methyltransferase [Anaerolineae bacterium]|nr:class I SAM-dependent methyltransferase [Anaerolineae bacterium]
MSRTGLEPQWSPPAFDAAAGSYDATFTHTRLGRWLREAVRARLASLVAPGQRVLELGCGTGEDAIWLAQRGVRVVATDISAAMLKIARAKAARAGLDERITFALLDLAAPDTAGTAHVWANTYNVVFSNFGALNCLPDRRALVQTLSHHTVAGAHVCVVLMNPLCAWEIAWHLLHLQPKTALRRWRAGAEAHAGGGERVRVWYPSPARLRREFAPSFRHRATVGIGVLLPPPYLGELVDRHPAEFKRLASWELKQAQRLPWRWLGDHYLCIFQHIGCG